MSLWQVGVALTSAGIQGASYRRQVRQSVSKSAGNRAVPVSSPPGGAGRVDRPGAEADSGTREGGAERAGGLPVGLAVTEGEIINSRGPFPRAGASLSCTLSGSISCFDLTRGSGSGIYVGMTRP